MEIINERSEKLELEYPCDWAYKLIASEKKALEHAIHDVIETREHTLTHSNNQHELEIVSS